MKIFLTGLTGLVLSTAAVTSTTAATVRAETLSAIAPTLATTKQAFRLTPSQLVDTAYRGQIEGIPGYRQFIRADYRPRELTQLAIDAGRLPPETIDDSRYLNSVALQLRSFRPSRFN
ncbi:MAG: hypothetical protein AAF152_21110 [Cyanobacteria bacterium P01_A01_bin.114]